MREDDRLNIPWGDHHRIYEPPPKPEPVPDFIPDHTGPWLKRLGALLLAAVLVVLVAAASMVFALPAHAHDWYDGSCCNEKDCEHLADTAVTITSKGYHVRIEPGEHPMVTEFAVDEVIPYGDIRLEASLDHLYHACLFIAFGKVTGIRCLYTPLSG